MHILWFVNIPLPAVLNRQGKKAGGSGWWLVGLLEELAKDPAIKITVVNCSPSYPSDSSFEENGINYIMVPANIWNISGFNSGKLIKKLAGIVQKANPDIVNVHGSEYAYGLITQHVTCPVVLTIQGFVSAVAQKAYGAYNMAEVLFLQTRTLKDIKPSAAMIYNDVITRIRARVEQRILRLNKYFIGRTAWDKKTIYEMSPNVRIYSTCWEIVRSPFYTTQWSVPSSKGKTIFYCSRPAPFKGVDNIIEVLPTLKARFKSISLKIAGDKTTTGWAGYLKRRAATLGVEDNVNFLGYLSAQQITDELRACSVNAHPSFVDNSPNTLAEAMCVGVPCVASTTGGIPSMISDGIDGLLFETGNKEALCSQLLKILGDDNLAVKLGTAARSTALARHDPKKVADETLNAYKTVIEDWKKQ